MRQVAGLPGRGRRKRAGGHHHHADHSARSLLSRCRRALGSTWRPFLPQAVQSRPSKPTGAKATELHRQKAAVLHRSIASSSQCKPFSGACRAVYRSSGQLLLVRCGGARAWRRWPADSSPTRDDIVTAVIGNEVRARTMNYITATATRRPA